MGVGQDVAVCADNEAGTEILVFVFIGVLQLRGVGHQAFEEVVKRIVFGERTVVGLVGIIFGLFGCLDVDHGRTFLLHKLGKVGQQHIDFTLAGLCLDRLGKNLLLRFGCRNIIAFFFFTAGGQCQKDGSGKGEIFVVAVHVLLPIIHRGKRQNFNGFAGILPECVIKGRLKTDCFFRRPFAVTGLMSEQVVHVGCLPLGCRLGGLVCFRGRLVNRLYRGFAVFRTFVDRLQRYFTAI